MSGENTPTAAPIPDGNQPPEDNPNTKDENNKGGEPDPNTTNTGGKQPSKDNPPSDPKEDGHSKDPKGKDELNLNYNEYEDPLLNQVTGMLKDAKVSVEDANAIFKEVAETGDFSKLDREALKKRLGEKSDIALALVENYFNKQTKRAEAVKSIAVDVVGDAETFTQLTKWAKEKASIDQEFAAIFKDAVELVDTGKPMAVKSAVAELYQLYKSDPNTTIEADLNTPTSASGKPTIKPMSRVEYATARAEVHRKHNGDPAKLAALWQQYQQSNNNN